MQDLTGRRFGRLTVTRFFEMGVGRQPRWVCQCDCGTEKIVYRSALIAGSTQSCGCLSRENTAERFTKHGMYLRPEYKIWSGIVIRCTNEDREEYSNYGGRGIQMCERWRESFEAFFADMGPRPSPSHSIDRVDNDGNYEPGNCRWADSRQQSRNSRRNRYAVIDGEQLCLKDAAARRGIPYAAVRGRLRLGWTIERALSKPSAGRKMRHGI